MWIFFYLFSLLLLIIIKIKWIKSFPISQKIISSSSYQPPNFIVKKILLLLSLSKLEKNQHPYWTIAYGLAIEMEEWPLGCLLSCLIFLVISLYFTWMRILMKVPNICIHTTLNTFQNYSIESTLELLFNPVSCLPPKIYLDLMKSGLIKFKTNCSKKNNSQWRKFCLI